MARAFHDKIKTNDSSSTIATNASRKSTRKYQFLAACLLQLILHGLKQKNCQRQTETEAHTHTSLVRCSPKTDATASNRFAAATRADISSPRNMSMACRASSSSDICIGTTEFVLLCLALPPGGGGGGVALGPPSTGSISMGCCC